MNTLTDRLKGKDIKLKGLSYKLRRNLYITISLKTTMKKRVIFLFLFVIMLTSLTIAQEAKLEITPIKESYKSGENITIRISLLDSSNKPINTQISVILTDVEKRSTIKKTITSNKIESISLGKNAPSGFWEIIATYEGKEAKASLLVESNEEVKFSIEGDVLTITNVGNTFYEKEITIIIDDTIGKKNPSLDVGESASFRLIAPEGTYNIRVTDGTSSITQGGVSLTGEVIGILDDRINKRTPITGVGPQELEGSSYYFVKQNPLIYTFVVVVVGAAILLGIERHYRRKAKSNF